MMNISKKPMKKFVTAIRHEETREVPVALWAGGPFLSGLVNCTAIEYYKDSELKLKAQLFAQHEFPEAILIPGIWADFGQAVEPSSFGCDILWREDTGPYLKPAFQDIHKVLYLRGINPEKDGLMPRVLKEYNYFWKKLDSKYIEDYGYLNGVAFSMGPVETAALVIGYEKFLLDIYDHPSLIHKLLNIVTHSIILWLKAQEKINGKLKRLFIADHLSSQVSPAHFEEFYLPYLKAIFKEFSEAIRLYHNEGDVLHVLDKIPELGMNIFQFGVDIERAKRTIGDNVCLMGNLDPVNLLLKGRPNQIIQECERCIKLAAPGGGYILSAAGGLARGTPKENVKTMVKSVKFSGFNKNNLPTGEFC